MPKVSIILPVYNAEKYLRETIDSVLVQTYGDFELIAINDGSKDNSLSILKEYAKKDERIVIIDKPNTGVSDTRNVGISIAKGEYVAFLDADDLYDASYLSVLLSVVEEKKAEVVVCEYETFRTVRKERFDKNRQVEASLTTIEELLNEGIMTSMQIKLFSKEVLDKNDIKLAKNMTFGEDLFFCWKACLVSKAIYKIPQKLYGYRLSGEGATSKYHANLYDRYKEAFDDLKIFCVDKGLNSKENLRQINLHFTRRLPSLFFMCERSKMRKKQKKEYLLKILNDEDISNVLKDDFDSLTKGLSNEEVKLYKNVRAKNINGVLRFGRRRKIKIQLSILKSRLLKVIS